MHHRTFLLASIVTSLAGGSALVGCTTAHDADPMLASATRAATPLAPLAAPTALEACLAGGGALIELGTVDNNDQHDHGALLTFGVSPSGLVAAAGADGTLKFWTLDATLVGVADPGILTYGPELGGAPITDLAFTEEVAIAGDVRGLVQQLGPDGAGGVVGGTDPDVAIVSVAFDRASGLLAHAQGGASAPDVLPLIVKSLDGERRWNVEDTLASITDLGFTTDGALVVGGTDGGYAALEIRDAADPTRVVARPAIGTDASVVEVATASEGPEVVVVTTHAMFLVDGDDSRPLATTDAAFRSATLTPSGEIVVTMDADGALVARRTRDGEELARTRIPTGIAARIDATGERIVAGGADAMLHVLTCAE